MSDIWNPDEDEATEIPGADESTGGDGEGDTVEDARTRALRDLRAMLLLEDRARSSAHRLPPILSYALTSSIQETRDRVWNEAIDPPGADVGDLSEEVLAELRGRIKQRVRGRDLKQTLRALNEIAGLSESAPLAEEAGAASPDPSSPAASVDEEPDEIAFLEAEEADEERATPRGRRAPAWVKERPPRRSWSEAAATLPLARQLPALMEELSIHWLLFLGAFLVLGGALVWSLSFWLSESSGEARYLPLAITTGFFQGLSWLVDRRFRLVLSSRVLAWIALLLLPLNALVIAVLGLGGSSSGLALAACAGVLLGLAGFDAARRGLAAEGGELRPEAATGYYLRYLGVCALVALWPALSGTTAVLGVVAGWLAASVLLAPGIMGLLQGERPVKPGSLAFATFACVAAYLCLAFRVGHASGAVTGAVGLLLLGAVHLFSTASAGLAARLKADEAEDPAGVSWTLAAAGRLCLVASAALVLSAGLTDNPWLAFGLLYFAFLRGRSYAAAGRQRHALEAFFAGLAGQVLLVYGQSDVLAAWREGLSQLLGRGFPVLLVPQLAVGLASTVAAMVLGRERLFVATLFLLNGAATAIGAAAIAVPYGAPGLPVSLSIVAFFGGMAAAFRFRYMAAVAVWAALCCVAGGLLALEAPGLVWIYTALALSWMFGRAGRAGADAIVARMDPSFVPDFSLHRTARTLAILAGLALLPVSLQPPLDGWHATAAFVVLALLAADLGQRENREITGIGIGLALVAQLLHTGHALAFSSGTAAAWETRVAQVLLGVATIAAGYRIHSLGLAGTPSFHAAGTLTSLAGAIAAIPTGVGGLALGSALVLLHGLGAMASRWAYHVFACLVSALAVTAAGLVATQASAETWCITTILWAYGLEAIGRLRLDEAVRSRDPMLVGKLRVSALARPLGWAAGLWLAMATSTLAQGRATWALLLLALLPLHFLWARRAEHAGNASSSAAWLLGFSLTVLPASATLSWYGPALATMYLAFGLTGRHAYVAATAIVSALLATAGWLLHAEAGQALWLMGLIGWVHLLSICGRLGLDGLLARKDPLLVGRLTTDRFAAPLAWLAAALLLPASIRAGTEPGLTVAGLVLLGVFFAQRAMGAQDERAAYASIGAPILAYVHLKACHILPDSQLTHLLVIVGSYPLLLLARSLSGKLAVYRNVLRHLALALPAVTATAGALLWEDVTSAALEIGCAGAFYNLTPRAGESRRFHYLAGGLYNVANFFFWDLGEAGSALYWSIPAGLTLLIFTHVNRGEIPAGPRDFMRLLGTLLISGHSIWEVVSTAEPTHALVLGILSGVGVVAALHLRVRAYLMYATLLLVVDVAAFVVRAVYQVSQLGAGALVLGGLALIALAALFEQSRTTLMRKFREMQAHMRDWE